MRRDSPELTAAARRRLALLGRDLDDPDPDPEPVVLTAPGRHLRAPVPTGGLLDRYAVGLRDRFGLTGAHLAIVAVLVAGVLAIVAWSTLRSAPAATTVPVARTSPAAPTAAPTVPTAAGAGGQVVVDVAGKVRRPGVATLPAGSRVIDALRRAGGAKPGVDLSGLNLARVLVDGEQVRVGAPAVAAADEVGAPAAGGLVNLNTATPEQLEELPGVGPVTAGKIVERRTRDGPFTAVDELLEVDGIGEKTMAELAPHVTL